MKTKQNSLNHCNGNFSVFPWYLGCYLLGCFDGYSSCMRGTSVLKCVPARGGVSHSCRGVPTSDRHAESRDLLTGIDGFKCGTNYWQRIAVGASQMYITRN